MVTKFKTKQVKVEAVQLLNTPESILEVTQFLEQTQDVGHNTGDYAREKWDEYLDIVRRGGGIGVTTKEGRRKAVFGDYIFKGINEVVGVHFYPVKSTDVKELFDHDCDHTDFKVVKQDSEGAAFKCNTCPHEWFQIF